MLRRARTSCAAHVIGRTVLVVTTILPATSMAGPSATPGPSTRSVEERPPLGPLPKLPSLEVPPPTAASLEALDAHLARLVSRDPGDRETAAAEVLEVERDRLAAIHRRIGSIAESSDHVAMKDVLNQIRDKTHEEKKGPTPDYLEMLVAHARVDSKPFRDLLSIVGMSRMLRHIGTVGAARE